MNRLVLMRLLDTRARREARRWELLVPVIARQLVAMRQVAP